MLKEILHAEFPELMSQLIPLEHVEEANDLDFCQLAISLYSLMGKSLPHDPHPVSRIAEAYHLRGELRTAGEYYKQVLQRNPPQTLTQKEEERVMKFAPVLYTHPDECFDLLDVAAIHHPEKSLICYHLFWEDDYDFPDDYEPCDHEQIWIAYDPLTEQVTRVSSFFHSRIISSEEAVEEANQSQGQAVFQIEWGKHGTLVKGWEKLFDPYTKISILDFLKINYELVAKGGRVPDHPLKQRWPEKFEGTFADYLDFSGQVIDTREWLQKKKMMIKSNWSNAVLQQYFLRYNFHPKYDWPDSLNSKDFFDIIF